MYRRQELLIGEYNQAAVASAVTAATVTMTKTATASAAAAIPCSRILVGLYLAIA